MCSYVYIYDVCIYIYTCIYCICVLYWEFSHRPHRQHPISSLRLQPSITISPSQTCHISHPPHCFLQVLCCTNYFLCYQTKWQEKPPGQSKSLSLTPTELQSSAVFVSSYVPPTFLQCQLILLHQKSPNPPTQPDPTPVRQVTQVLRRISPLPSSQVVRQRVVALEHLNSHTRFSARGLLSLFWMQQWEKQDHFIATRKPPTNSGILGWQNLKMNGKKKTWLPKIIPLEKLCISVKCCVSPMLF